MTKQRGVNPVSAANMSFMFCFTCVCVCDYLMKRRQKTALVKTGRRSYLCCRPSAAGWDGAGGRGSGAAARVELGAGCAANVGRGAPRVAAGAGRATGAARAGGAESAQRVADAESAEGADCVGHVGCGCHRAARGAVRGVSRGQGGLGRGGTAAPAHCW